MRLLIINLFIISTFRLNILAPAPMIMPFLRRGDKIRKPFVIFNPKLSVFIGGNKLSLLSTKSISLKWWSASGSLDFIDALLVSHGPSDNKKLLSW